MFWPRVVHNAPCQVSHLTPAPFFRAVVKYTRQHLGDSASSVHKRIRCPHCQNGFKSWKEVGRHQENFECSIVDSIFDWTAEANEDISKEKWSKIERDVSRAAFQKLDVHFRNKIDHWVLENLDSYAPKDPIESRRGELRKWYLVWHILSPDVDPPAPCKFLYSHRSANQLTAYSLRRTPR